MLSLNIIYRTGISFCANLNSCGLKKGIKDLHDSLSLVTILYLCSRLCSLVPFTGKIEKLIDYRIYFTS